MEMISIEQAANELIRNINTMLEKKPSGIVIAVDGRCASGKTTLTDIVQERLSCNVIRMDHFFLRPIQRSEERYSVPGGNIDYERFLAEVAPQLYDDGEISYIPFECKSKAFGAPIVQKRSKIIIVEGSYCNHPMLWDLYDLHCFLTVDKDVQMQRIISRNGSEMAKVFEEKWIPLEEKYFSSCNIIDNCGLVMDMTGAAFETLQSMFFTG